MLTFMSVRLKIKCLNVFKDIVQLSNAERINNFATVLAIPNQNMFFQGLSTTYMILISHVDSKLIC
jgi:hypothetical protein